MSERCAVHVFQEDRDAHQDAAAFVPDLRDEPQGSGQGDQESHPREPAPVEQPSHTEVRETDDDVPEDEHRGRLGQVRDGRPGPDCADDEADCAD